MRFLMSRAPPARPQSQGVDAPAEIRRLIEQAVSFAASDIHLEPTARSCEARYRIDGLLRTVATFDGEAGQALVARLMVCAELLTYRRDVPQEGWFQMPIAGRGEPLDLRVAVMPTAHGLRAVVRLPAELHQPRDLDELGLAASTLDPLRAFAQMDSGMLVLCGPAGSGKTTAIYALLDHILRHQPGLSVISLEDPIERDLPSVTQIQVNPFGELTYEKALRSILRQDPQVLALGEIRDRATASLAVQAALSGHRLITTLHAATPQGALVRLREMGIERYQLASAMYGVGAMRLVRRLNDSSAYQGRVPVSEFARIDEAVRTALSEPGDASAIRRAIESQSGFESLRAAGRRLVEDGVTDQSELDRVLASAADAV